MFFLKQQLIYFKQKKYLKPLKNASLFTNKFNYLSLLVIFVLLCTPPLAKQALASDNILVDIIEILFVPSYAPSGQMSVYRVTDTLGNPTGETVEHIAEYTERDTLGFLKLKADEFGEDRRIVGYLEHDEEMEQYKKSVQKRVNTLSDSSLGQFQNYHNGVAKTAAFASSLVYTDNLRTKTELEKAGFILIKYFDDRRESQDNQFFLASKIVNGKKKFIIAIRGTASGTDVKRDLNTLPLSLESFGVYGTVHKGFGYLAQAVYEEAEVQKALQEVKENKADLLITGHSLGGAAANIFAVMLQENGVPLDNMQTYTFGAPPVGNENFFAHYESQGRIFRVREVEDPVPYSSYFAFYKHIGEPHSFIYKIGTFQKYIPPEESAKWHVSISDIQEDIEIGFMQIYTSRELTVVAISEAGEGIYRLTTATNSILVTISDGSLNPLSNYDLNPSTNYDKNAFSNLIEDINKLELGAEKLTEAFQTAIEAKVTYADGVLHEVIALSKSGYKNIRANIILSSIIPYHIMRLALGDYDHSHSMDNTYIDIINNFHFTDIAQNMMINNTLIDKTNSLVATPFLLYDAAKLINETPQDDSVFQGGASFVKKWTLQNTGTSTWNSNYKIRHVSGSTLSSSDSEVKVTENVSPGSSYTFEVPMEMPSTETVQRTLTDTWEFVNPNGTMIKVNNSAIIWARIKLAPSEGIECLNEEIPEATSGFTWPLSYSFSNNGGYQFKQKAIYKDYVYHPGEDWNVPNPPGGNGDGDKGLNVIAVANGKVVFVAPDSWGGLVIQHNYQGNTWYSQYGHVQNISVNLGSAVIKGQKVAEIGRVGVSDSYAHLHFEIRTSNHPNPCLGYYWSYGVDGLYNLNNIDSWYEDPNEFIPAHPAYSNAPHIVVHSISQETGEIVISGQDIDFVEYINIQEGLDNNTIAQLLPNLTQDGTIPLNVFQQLGLSLNSLNDPLKLELFDTNNNLLYEVCYPFIDVCPNMWMAHPTTFLWKKDIVKGYGGDWEGYFKPYIPTTRAEFIAALVRAIEGNDYAALSANPFADVSINDWYAPYVQYAKDIGLIQGCDQTKNLFCPDDAITRAEAIKIVVSAFDKFQTILPLYQNKTRQPIAQFTDVSQDAWYYPYVYTAQAKHLLNYRDGQFNPNDALNRAEMAKLICFSAFSPMQCTDMGLMQTLPELPQQPDPIEQPDEQLIGDGLIRDEYFAGDNLIYYPDGTVATTCTFGDIKEEIGTAWFTTAVKQLCSAGILIGGGKVNSTGERLYEPANKTNLVEVLKVLLYAYDYERIGELKLLDENEDWYKLFLDEAENTYDLPIDRSKYNDPVTKEQLLEYIAHLFYGEKTGGADYLTSIDFSSNDGLDENASRALLAALAYKAANEKNRYIHYGLVGSPLETISITTAYGQDIANKAATNIDKRYPYVDGNYTYCARFVRTMFEKPAKWASAKEMCNHYDNLSLIQTTQNPPAGAAICYLPSDSNWNYGHIAISTGTGQEIGTTSIVNGVTQRDIYYGTGYQGWIRAEDYNDYYDN
jgi:murein DD-endopeptidase MepM/ murein hydrolase activator NlpD